VAITYCLAVMLMTSIGVERPFLQALVPTMGYFLSTLSLRLLKKQWIAKIYQNNISRFDSTDQNF
jgi:hypothetical protein